jgi:hypothetical protein
VRRASLLLAVPLIAALASSARAGVRCTAVRRGDRVILAIRLERMFDRELLRLVRLGLAGKLRIQATLYRRRPYWFDDDLATRTIAAVVTHLRPDRWLLDGGREVDPGAVELPALSLGVGTVAAGGHYVRLTARLQVVTTASLGRAASWLTRGGGQAVSSRALLNAVVSDLARTAEATCEVVEPRR